MRIELHDEEDNTICWVGVDHIPITGDVIWISGPLRDKVIESHGTAAFIVTKICHWVSERVESHSICCYVDPILDKG